MSLEELLKKKKLALEFIRSVPPNLWKEFHDNHEGIQLLIAMSRKIMDYCGDCETKGEACEDCIFAELFGLIERYH